MAINFLNNSVFAGDVTIPEYIYHAGNTSQDKFGFAGNDTFVISTNGTDKFTADANSAILLEAGITKLQTTSGGVDITGALAVGNINMTGTLDISAAYPRINLNDTNHEDDWSIINDDGSFKIYNVDDSVDSFKINSSNNATFAGDVGLGGTGLYTASHSLNIDGTGLAIKNNVSGSSNNWSHITNSATASSSNLVFTTGSGIALTLAHNTDATFTGRGIFSDNVQIVYTGNKTNDAGLYIENDSDDWGIHVNKNTNNFGIRITSDGGNAFGIYSDANVEKITFSGTGAATFAGSITTNLSSEGTYFTGGSGGVRQLSITSGTNTSAHALHTFNIASSNGKYEFDVNGTTELSLDSSSAVFAGSIKANGGMFNNVDGLRLINPGGGSSVTQTSTVTGAIKITLPVTHTDTMMRMTIKVYEYTTNESFTVVLGGYNYSSGNIWYNCFAHIESNATVDRNFTVRFGYGSSKGQIYIGELNSQWSYPQVFVTDFQAGYSSYTASSWQTGWDVNFETSAFGSVTKTITNPQVNNWARNGSNLSYTSGSGNVLVTTQSANDNSTKAASTAYVDTAVASAGSGTFLPLVGGTMANTNLVTNMNADLLDGFNASQFLRSDAADTSTGEILFDAGFKSDSILLSGPQNFDNISRSGFYNLYNTASGSTNPPPSLTYGTMIVVGGNKQNSSFGLQIAHERTGSGMYVRGMNDTGSTWYAWDEIWNSGNDGAGSGLDADLLDAQQGSYYLDYNNATNKPTIVSQVTSGNTNTITVGGGSTTPTIAANTAAVSSGSTNLATGAQIQTAINTALLGVLSYQGTWNASTNSPALASGVGTPGYYYIVSTAGSTNLDGITDWAVGDWAVFSDLATDAWQKIDNTQVGNVTGSGANQRLAFWNSTSNIASDDELTWDGVNLNIGTYAGTGDCELRLFGSTPNNSFSTLKTTNGNLHIDADNGHAIYLNYYLGGSTSVIIGNGSGGVSGTQFNASGDVIIGDELTITTILNATADPDKFLCASGGNKVGYRTGAQLLSDIGGAPATGGSYLPLIGGNMSGQIDAETIEFDGIVNSSAVGALIGRNHAYDTLELRGHGAELMIGSKNQDLHINYRTCNNGAANNTPINWFWRAGSSSSFSNHSFGTVTATSLKVDTFSNNAGNLIFSAGNATTGAGRSLNLRITSPTTDPSSSDDSNSTGITWGQRTDSQPYYIIYPNLENWSSSGNYSKLTLAWHTGIKIGAGLAYGGTRFYNNSPGVSGAAVILNVGVGNSNIGVVNNLTVGGQATGPAPTTTTSYANKAYVDAHPGTGGTVTSVATGAGLTGGTITTSGTLSLDRPDSQLGAVLATYGTTNGASGRIRCTAPFNTNSSKMFSIEVTLYTSYTQHNYVVSAYMYSSTNQWYSPKAIYTTTGTSSPDIYVGRDANGKAYISIANGAYTGVLVHNMTRGYYTTLADTYDPWTITVDAGNENSTSVAVSTVYTSANFPSSSYLPVNNPTFTGTLTGPAATITTVTGTLAGNASSATTAGTLTHNRNRTDGTSYPVVWMDATSPSPAYSCAAVTITSSVGRVNATTFNGALTGNASTATTFSTGRTNYKGVTDGAVAGQLMWKNYGNNHTIFDASNGTSPSGSTISNADSAVAWTGTYPTLMGWNGSSTYGVRVDSARLADSATTAAAYLPLAGGTMANTNLVTNMNADLLDGISSASFLRSDVTDTATQRISFSANDTNNWDTIATAAGNQGGIQIFNNGAGNDAFMAFHAGNDYAFYFGIDADNNQLSVGGWSMGANKYKVWNESNDGAGSGLDADLLDGQQGSYYVNTATTQSIAGAKTFTTTPISVTRSTADNSTYLATTAFVKNQGYTGNSGTISSINATTNGGALGASNTLTANGTLTLAWQGNTASYVRGDGSLATFPTIPQGDVTGITVSNGITGSSLTGPVPAISMSGTYAGNFNFSTNNVVVGGNFSNNAYNSTTGARLMFGGGNSDAIGNYYIGTNLENFGGNYNKLDLRWHTGIRIGAQSQYGGVRIYDSEDLGTVLFSVGTSGTNVAVTNNLTIGSDLTVSGGDITLGGISGRIQGVVSVISGSDATSKTYVDSAISTAGNAFLPLAGGTMTGALTVKGRINFPSSGLGTVTRGGESYGIYQESGSWTNPYPDLCIGFHTGISMGANASYNGIRFFNDSTLATQVMSINNGSDGFGANNVYINNNLRVNGGTLVLGNTGVGDMYLGNYATNKHFRFHTNNNQTYFDMNCGQINWREGSSTRYYFYPSTANMTINGTLTQNSDSRVKENVVEIGNCISKVQAMRGVYYNRTDFNTEVTKVGVIAQEVEAVLPELILEAPDTGLKSVAYAELTAVLINAIKEQQEIIEDLKTRITKLEK